MKIENFFKVIKKHKVSFFTGVPDSFLKSFIDYISSEYSAKNHIPSTNEGSAIALAIGYYLATEKIPLVYMQNSGFGNCVNPLLSLADKKIYSIPMILLIGWRGEPKVADEPQHLKQGEITLKLLKSMGIPYVVIRKDSNNSEITRLIKESKERSVPIAIVVAKNSFEKIQFHKKPKSDNRLSREQAISLVVSLSNKNSIFVSTTGMASRELYEYRKNNNQINRDFLTVGGMGHASQIALGIASQKKNKTIICIDGDGALLMHMGSIAMIGNKNYKNFKHILINNGAHDSTGGQPTIANNLNLVSIAKMCGYTYAKSCITEASIKKTINDIKDISGSCFIEIKVKKGNRNNLGRPKLSPEKTKKIFMKYIK